jgi:thioredoxin-like negative regulator of GroEL
VDVYARWCPTCLAQHRALSSLLADPRYGSVQGIRVDFDRDTDYRRVHNVPAQSTMLFFGAGRELSRSVGVTNAEAIRQQLDRALLLIAEPPR